MPGPSSRTETTHWSRRSSSSTHASASRPTWWRTLLRHASTAESTSLATSAGIIAGLPGTATCTCARLQPREQPDEVLVAERRHEVARVLLHQPAQPHLLLAGEPAQVDAVRAQLRRPTLDQRERLEDAVVDHPRQSLALLGRRGRALRPVALGRGLLEQPGQEAHDGAAQDQQEDVAVGLLGELVPDADVRHAHRQRRHEPALPAPDDGPGQHHPHHPEPRDRGAQPRRP